MRVVFRTDASLEIGSGHVMRCLTLADSLKAAGAKCGFICRAHHGHLLDMIRERGHESVCLPVKNQNVRQESSPGDETQLAHAAWLGTDWRTDAEQTGVALNGQPADWLIVDHYALDDRWESALKPHYKKLMVIDDLADRKHLCDVLLDQNLTIAIETRYGGKVPEHCVCLNGPQYALLRPEFNALRATSLARRKKPSLNRLLVFMGGSDAEDETSKVIEGIKISERRWKHIDVIVGQSFPALQDLQERLMTLPSAELHIQTPNMAALMTSADLAVTAGGSVTWEKCALGLPSLVAILGENQRPIATMMHERGAQRTMELAPTASAASYAKYLDAVQAKELREMSDRASAICDGTGTIKVSTVLRCQI